MYLKRHLYKTSYIIMSKKLNEPRKFDPHEISNHTIQYKLLQHKHTL